MKEGGRAVIRGSAMWFGLQANSHVRWAVRPRLQLQPPIIAIIVVVSADVSTKRRLRKGTRCLRSWAGLLT